MEDSKKANKQYNHTTLYEVRNGSSTLRVKLHWIGEKLAVAHVIPDIPSIRPTRPQVKYVFLNELREVKTAVVSEKKQEEQLAHN